MSETNQGDPLSAGGTKGVVTQTYSTGSTVTPPAPKPGPQSGFTAERQAEASKEEASKPRSNEDPEGGAPGDLSGVFTSTEKPGQSPGDVSDQTGRQEAQDS